ncbi:MAG: ribosomal-processing cysteine protease Prp [Bacillota bacterium]|uniref:Ribosomal processing cysteine protease Prp n=1 Tax=Virgibacillus salarius TaxID=447199 RepID=A0A941DW61_9BACI|nr:MULTISPECIES: ribosomal-processing cysteine protease Prp [Bacillaceae]MBR7797830.1 ribosomal-processing cysteine protease Prp [Virgibacillus salarius]NAZ10540.1 ribosomal-processing cysteine protease Prp [Agaribacter marinus]WBX79025.1 ribosomal-processing cysteine protease Prp [Virgibacillus salarius]
MIRVTVFRTNERITAFELSGHADSGPYGYDLVCAGVSAVSIGTINAVMALCEVDLIIEQGQDGGYLHVTIPASISEEKMEQIQLLFEGMIISLTSIEQEYSDFIQIESK